MPNQASVIHRTLGYLVRKNLAMWRLLNDRYFDEQQSSLISFRPKGRKRGHVLISHNIRGFMLPRGAKPLTHHTLFQEARKTVDIFVNRGYQVDLISHKRRKIGKRRRYDIFFGAWDNMEAISEQINGDCIKIVRLDISHWAFNNHASIARSLEVQRSRGITPRHIDFRPNRGIECADYGVMFGNEFVYNTYAFAKKPIFALPHPAVETYPAPDHKNFSVARHHFLWLGSRGLAHKGLGRTLEAFARMPRLQLTVCGPVFDDHAFVEAYRHELVDCPNIHAHGWIDVTGRDFGDLAQNTLAMVYPSCAEGQAGSVINCMQAGLIPVVSDQAGLDTDPCFGIKLEDDSVEGVVDAVTSLASRPATELESMTRRTWEHARNTYTIENFERVLGEIIDRIAAEHPDLKARTGFFRYRG